MDNYLLNNNNEKNNRGGEKTPPKKFDFIKYKKNTFQSLKDVDYFLNNFHHYFKYYKIIKLLKK